MKSFSQQTKKVLQEYGDFCLTSDGRAVKGQVWDSEDACTYGSYLSSEDLRKIAAACIEVADYIDSKSQRASGGESA